MSDLIETIDLTLYGCPLHYIKARAALESVEAEQDVLFIVNNGDSVDEVLRSLRQDRHICEKESEGILTTTIRVTRKI